jgi:hypothetical protein
MNQNRRLNITRCKGRCKEINTINSEEIQMTALSKVDDNVKHQRAASSVVFSDLCNLNRTVYLYVYVCIFLYKFIFMYYNSSCKAPGLIHTEFCLTTVELHKKSFMFIFYDSHTLSLHIMATSLTKTLKGEFKTRGP